MLDVQRAAEISWGWHGKHGILENSNLRIIFICLRVVLSLFSLGFSGWTLTFLVMAPEVVLSYWHNSRIRDFKMITSYPSFHDKIVTLGSTSGSSKVNSENSEVSFTSAAEAAAGLQTTRPCRSQWAGSLAVSQQKVLQNNSVLSKLPKLQLPC